MNKINRRIFLTVGAGIAGGLLLGGAYLKHSANKNIEQVYADLTKLLHKLNRLKNKNLQSKNEWTPFKHLAHCNQSIEFSMSNYPHQKPLLFQATVGQVILSTFLSKKRIYHNLSKETTNAPELATVGETDQLIEKIQNNLVKLISLKKNNSSHEYFGKLSVSEITLFHIYHVTEHLRMIEE